MYYRCESMTSEGIRARPSEPPTTTQAARAAESKREIPQSLRREIAHTREWNERVEREAFGAWVRSIKRF